jgi:putative RNA 2'-phosphotransferase
MSSTDMDEFLVRVSKFLSFVLRHQPEAIDLELDSGGWAYIDDLVEKSMESRRPLTAELIREVVEKDEKQRYALSEDGQKVRARYGHSIEIDLGIDPIEPPEILYHGTVSRHLGAIHMNGIVKGGRQYVHLSPDIETAIEVGRRHGRPVVLEVMAREMHNEGVNFYRIENGIWLTEDVPPKYIRFPRQKHRNRPDS